MIARWQRVLCLLGLGAMLAWVWACLADGRPLAALAAPAIVAAAYAAVLGLEFLLLHLVPVDAGEPRAGVGQTLRAWAGELLAAMVVFCWRQPFRSRTRPDHLPPDARGRRGVLLVHGFLCNRGLWNRWLARLSARGVPVVAVNLEPVFGSIDAYAPIIDAALRRLEQATGMAPIAVAHSMGGLALRRWWAEAGNGERVHHALTLGTPHRGTWLARWGAGRNAAQMRLDSPWLQGLVAAEPAERAQRFTCLFSPCDNIVFPPTTATLPGADNRMVLAVGHVQLVESPQGWDALQALLATPPAS
jgi:triacylglycerol lipase